MAEERNKGIVYVGSMDPQSNSYRRFMTLRSMGYDMTGVDIDSHIFKSFFSSIHYRYNIGTGIWSVGKDIIRAVKLVNPKILWFDNKIFAPVTVIRYLKRESPGIVIINLITDDVTGHAKAGWRLTLRAAPLVDFHFVQRKINVTELKPYGARNVHICYRSFDPAFHRRLSWTDSERQTYHCEVGFIGTYEAPREEFIAYLIDHGIRVQVTGNDWPKGRQWEKIKPFYKGPSVYGEEYIRTINGMDIALHFLRHSNRDEQDSRTFEIPACGAFMLAERSDLHMTLFEENKEAVFFSSKEELLSKVTQYLARPAERMQIADAGMRKCHTAGFTHESRLKEVMAKLYEHD